MKNQKDSSTITGLLDPFQRFFKQEASGGIVLLIFTLFALIWANSPWANSYFHLWETKVSIGFGDFKLSYSILHWVNDGFMAIFFFVVGLEIKRELIAGELSSIKKASLPISAAFGGMIFPALLYILFNSNPEAKDGWGIPMATDIAFSLGILSLLGKRVPLALKVFLVAFAIVDDLGAVLIIAIFYSHDLNWTFLLIGLSLVLILFVFNRLKIKSIHPYMVVGWVIWYMFLQSGIHPTIAGVLIAFTIPVKRTVYLGDFRVSMQNSLDYFCSTKDKKNKITLSGPQMAAIENMESELFNVQSPVQRIEHKLHSFVTFIVMPVFALTNAGVVLKDVRFSDIFSNISGTIEISLVLGKITGIFLFAWLSVKLGIAALPEKIKWKQILSIGILGGMGFTMSLFISGLAFKSEALLNSAKIGILTGSLIAGVGGYIALNLTLDKSKD